MNTIIYEYIGFTGINWGVEKQLGYHEVNNDQREMKTRPQKMPSIIRARNKLRT
jgi:hypothetical protein